MSIYSFSIEINSAPNSSKTCNEIGAIKKYHEKNNTNPILKEFTNEYKKMNARARLNKISREKFCRWSEEARNLKIKAVSENWTIDHFIIKLKELEE